jgi:dihydropteroate synthase
MSQLNHLLACRRIAKLQGVISVDTFYAEVAREAIKAGAHIVNDVTAGQGDNEMLGTVRNVGRGIVCLAAFRN